MLLLINKWECCWFSWNVRYLGYLFDESLPCLKKNFSKSKPYNVPTLIKQNKNKVIKEICGDTRDPD